MDNAHFACDDWFGGWVMVLGRGSSAAQSVAPLQTKVVLPLAKLSDGGFARIVVADAPGKRAWSNPIPR